MPLSQCVADILDEAFPSLKPDPGWPPNCWVARIKAREESSLRRLETLSEALDVIKTAGQLPNFISRLQPLHPVNKPHDDQFDERVQDAFNEACAFAWCITAFGGAEFALGQGQPDLRHKDVWIEAKNIHSSREDAAAVAESIATGEPMSGSVGDIHPTVIKKFGDGLNDALAKFQRVGAMKKYLFFNVGGFDVEVWPRKDEFQTYLCHWASEQEKRHGICIALTWGYQWQQPFYPTGKHYS